jgi:hypothetical protein
VFRLSMAIEVSGSCSAEHIDEAILGDHLQTNLWISCEKARHDPRKDEPHGAHRHIEPECAGRLVAKWVHDIES